MLDTELYRVFCSEGRFINPTIAKKDNLPYYISYDTSTKRLYIRKLKNDDENIYQITPDYIPEFYDSYKDPYCYNRENSQEIFLNLSNFTEIDYYFVNNKIIISYVRSSNLYVSTYDLDGNRISNVLIKNLSFKPSLCYSEDNLKLYLFYYDLTSRSIMVTNSLDDGETWSSSTKIKSTNQFIQSISAVIQFLDSIEVAFVMYRNQTEIKTNIYYL